LYVYSNIFSEQPPRLYVWRTNGVGGVADFGGEFRSTGSAALSSLVCYRSPLPYMGNYPELHSVVINRKKGAVRRGSIFFSLTWFFTAQQHHPNYLLHHHPHYNKWLCSCNNDV